ncbi:DUF2867 domain-containing protein [Arcobacter arenosus]|uniref:DUF2867 domain-containing protein n=1 Tax=Arcobacter arenosus TaxID=2576037 RepID=UPI001484FE75|nr:DUF2867 domain-containing protein [Arcobacter arenosus]
MSSIIYDSKVLEYIDRVDYTDSFETKVSSGETIKELYLELVNSKSKTTDFLMYIRNKIMSIFGVKTVDKNINDDFTVGSKIGLFKIYYISDTEIIAGEKDWHLDFCVSFFKKDDKVMLSTIVKYNNGFGKIYMNIIKPFHKLLVKNSLKKLNK